MQEEVWEGKSRGRHTPFFFPSSNNSRQPSFSILCAGNRFFSFSFRRHMRMTLPVFLHCRRRCWIGAVCHSQHTPAESESSFISLSYTSAPISALGENRPKLKLCKAPSLFGCCPYLLPSYHDFLNDNEVGEAESLNCLGLRREPVCDVKKKGKTKNTVCENVKWCHRFQ